jgi:hypothetical protein
MDDGFKKNVLATIARIESKLEQGQIQNQTDTITEELHLLMELLREQLPANQHKKNISHSAC